MGAIVRMTLAASVVALLLPAPASAVTYRVSVDDGFVVRLGPWKVRSRPHLHDAIAVLGEASSVKPVDGACKVRWARLGLKTTFTSFGGISDFCGEGFIQTAVIRSGKWRTWAGLRVGMRSSRVSELHHRAEFVRGKWVLASQDVYGSASSPTVSALVRDGRVYALSLWIGGAGD